jgi:excisionase family DNA binding protein
MQNKSLLGTKLLCSLREVSNLTGLSLRTSAKLIASRELNSIRVGRRRLVPCSELERFTKKDHSTVEAHSVHQKKVTR